MRGAAATLAAPLSAGNGPRRLQQSVVVADFRNTTFPRIQNRGDGGGDAGGGLGGGEGWRRAGRR